MHCWGGVDLEHCWGGVDLEHGVVGSLFDILYGCGVDYMWAGEFVGYNYSRYALVAICCYFCVSFVYGLGHP